MQAAKQTEVAAAEMRRRERQAYGGTIQWEAAFFGWLVATGLGAILVAMVIGAGVAVGLTEIDDPARTQAEQLSLGGGAALVAILAISYLAGGYVAGRMARFDGWRQGLGVWIVALAMTLALALFAWIAGGAVNPLENLELPRIPVDEQAGLSGGGAVALAIMAVVTLLAAVLGGGVGERFHRAVDAAGEAVETVEAVEAEAGESPDPPSHPSGAAP